MGDTETFSNCVGFIPRIEMPPVIPAELDPPEHGKYRGPLQSWFSMRNMERFENLIRQTARDLLADLGDECDLGMEYSRPLAMRVIALVLGAPEIDLDRIGGWMTHIVELVGSNPTEGFESFIEFFTYMLELVKTRRLEPANDVITLLNEAEVDGAPLPDETIAMMGFFVTGAGFETTAKTLATTLAHLADHPDLADALRRDEIPMGDAVEEFLRLFAGVTGVRTATKDCVVGGREIAAGDRLHLLFPSGSRDATAFEGGDDVNLDGATSRHLAFGGGVHRCLGMHLARLELRIGLEEFLRATSSFETRSDKPPEFKMAQAWGLRSVPARIQRRPA
jgi:cytochrome P450